MEKPSTEDMHEDNSIQFECFRRDILQVHFFSINFYLCFHFIIPSLSKLYFKNVLLAVETNICIYH